MKTDPRNATPVLGTTLRYSEEEWLLGGLFDIVPDAVVAVSRDGKIAMVNGHLELMFGSGQTELVRSPIEIPRARTRAPTSPRASRRLSEQLVCPGDEKGGTWSADTRTGANFPLTSCSALSPPTPADRLSP